MNPSFANKFSGLWSQCWARGLKRVEPFGNLTLSLRRSLDLVVADNPSKQMTVVGICLKEQCITEVR